MCATIIAVGTQDAPPLIMRAEIDPQGVRQVGRPVGGPRQSDVGRRVHVVGDAAEAACAVDRRKLKGVHKEMG
eukprot:3407958-Rhodomonas_salina.2